jgi:hypothetical protein
MLTNMKKRTALLLTLAVMGAAVVSIPQTAGAAASVVPNAGTAADVYTAPDDRTLLSACPGDSAPAAGFTDTTSTDVDCIKTLGVTQGTTATTYEPNANIPRWQMALFIHRMFTSTGMLAAGLTPVPAFTDTSGLSTEIQAAITALASHGITAGTTATTFSPNDNVTREQMAMFLSRFADIATSASGAAIASSKATGEFNYNDIASTTFEGMESIIRLYNLGATGETCLVDGVALGDPTGGCASTFRPSEDITRAEMATMLVGVLNHTNARPAGITIQTTTANAAVGTVSTMISVRNADGSAQANTNVDEFFQVHNDAAGVAAQSPWTAILNTCSANVTGTGGSKCIIDANDVATDIRGNAAGTNQTSAAYTTSNWWVWTGDAGEQYVNGTTDNVDTYSITFGAASTLQNAVGITYSSDAGTALVEDLNAMSGNVTMTDGISTFAGGSRTFTATLATTSATATATPGYSLKVVTRTVTNGASGNTESASTQYVAFDGKTASWTVTCAADDSALTTTYQSVMQQTVTFGGAVDTDGLPTGAANPGATGGAGNSITYGTGVGGANSAGANSIIGLSCNDTARAYTEAGTGESLSISTNNIGRTVAGTMMAITSTAFDQYGAGIAGVETEITRRDSVDGAYTAGAALAARLTTGTGGTATLSAVVCNGTTDFSEWSVADVDSGTTEMDAIGASVANASTSAAGEGTTVWCTAATTPDGAYGLVTSVRAAIAVTYAANLAAQDGGNTVWTIPGFAAFTSDSTPTVAEIATGLNAMTGITGVTCAASSGTAVATCTWAANTGAIWSSTPTVTSTLTDADSTNATIGGGGVVVTNGVDGITTNFVEDNPEEDCLIANIITSTDGGTGGAALASNVYTKFCYDSGDAFNLGTDGEIATVVPGASLAQFETEMASLTNEAGAAPMSISYRTGALTSGVSAFQIGT